MFLILLSSKVDELYTKEVYRQNLLALNSRLTEPFALKLLRATDTFIVKNPSSGENYSNCGISLVF